MIKAVTGTKDILFNDYTQWEQLENIVSSIMKSFNYKGIRTPIFEETILFNRGIGESSDIVGKEMYTLIDKGGQSLTLKPEMTACVVRAFIEHSLGKISTLNKFFYISPMFRQERPQAGRLRQFHQFGAEALGVKSPELDAEMIIISNSIFKTIGLKNYSVKVNSLGKTETRDKYKNILKEYLTPFLDNLSEDSKKRFNTNILRIFDSKIETDQKIMNNAPKLLDYLDSESKDHFDKVLNYLTLSDIKFDIDTQLVRGLDYYTETTFEITSGSVGSQSALCGGGRYDLLAEQLGGSPAPGVGFAAGIERILLACENEKTFQTKPENIDIYITRLEPELTGKAFDFASILRGRNYKTEIDYSNRSVKAQMREANKYNASYVIFIGGDEYKNNQFVLKNMLNGEQKNFNLSEINNFTI